MPRYLLEAGVDVRPIGDALVASAWVLSQRSVTLANPGDGSALLASVETALCSGARDQHARAEPASDQ